MRGSSVHARPRSSFDAPSREKANHLPQTRKIRHFCNHASCLSVSSANRLQSEKRAAAQSEGIQAFMAARQAECEAAKAAAATTQQGVGEVRDAVTLSTDGVRAAEGASDIRFDKVAALKAAIADGSYETPEKLDIALDRLLERLA